MPAGSGRTSGEALPPAPAVPPSPPLTPGLPAPCPPRRELSQEPHLASSPRDEALVQLLLQRWRDPESGLDSAEAATYEVLLSFPDQKQPNRVAVGEALLRPGMPVGWGCCQPSPDTALPTVGPTGDILFSCRQSEENLTGEQGGPDVVPPYAAYAPPGTPQVGLEHSPLPWPGPLAPPQFLPS